MVVRFVGGLGDNLVELIHGADRGDGGEDLEGVVNTNISEEGNAGSLGAVRFLTQARGTWMGYQDDLSDTLRLNTNLLVCIDLF